MTGVFIPILFYHQALFPVLRIFAAPAAGPLHLLLQLMQAAVVLQPLPINTSGNLLLSIQLSLHSGLLQIFQPEIHLPLIYRQVISPHQPDTEEE